MQEWAHPIAPPCPALGAFRSAAGPRIRSAASPYLGRRALVDYPVRGRSHLPRDPETLGTDNLTPLTAAGTAKQNLAIAGVQVPRAASVGIAANQVAA